MPACQTAFSKEFVTHIGELPITKCRIPPLKQMDLPWHLHRCGDIEEGNKARSFSMLKFYKMTHFDVVQSAERTLNFLVQLVCIDIRLVEWHEVYEIAPLYGGHRQRVSRRVRIPEASISMGTYSCRWECVCALVLAHISQARVPLTKLWCHFKPPSIGKGLVHCLHLFYSMKYSFSCN